MKDWLNYLKQRMKTFEGNVNSLEGDHKILLRDFNDLNEQVNTLISTVDSHHQESLEVQSKVTPYLSSKPKWTHLSRTEETQVDLDMYKRMTLQETIFLIGVLLSMKVEVRRPKEESRPTPWLDLNFSQLYDLRYLSSSLKHLIKYFVFSKSK